MNKNLTDINVVLDRSGSMITVAKDTIGGYNTFLKTQQEADGEAVLTLVQFDDKYEIVYEGKNIKDVPPLTSETFIPRGWTALLDAIGKTIVSTGERLAKMNEEDRPANIIFVILTDGMENQSKEYTKSTISEMIKHQTEVYNWDFVFIGANQDAIAVGSSMGFMAGNSMTYASNETGTKEVFASMSIATSAYRGGDITKKSSFFTMEDRQKQSDAI